MKKRILPTTLKARMVIWVSSLLFTGGFCGAQTVSSSAPPRTEDYSVAQVGPHSCVWQNSLGQSVTAIATGMNYWDGQQWTPSNPLFVVSPDGTAFVASQIQDPTQLAANINCEGAVTVTTPDNVTLRSTPIAIGLYDAASGLSAIVATLTNSTGQLVDAQNVVYNRALVGGGFAASVVYSLPDTASFHQDVVFVGFDPGFNPTNWGFAESSTNSLQIQIITEFYSPPEPIMIERPLYIEQNQEVRAAMASPDLIDFTLDFGDYVLGPGRAFTAATNASSGVRVAKDFVTSNGRTFLIESVPFLSLAGELEALPPVATNTGALTPPPQRAKRMRVAEAALPPLRGVQPKAGERVASGKTVAAVAVKPHGVTVDYIATVSSTTKPALYAADTTYFVGGTVVDSGPVTMESAVFKYPTNSIGSIEIESTLALSTTNYRPAIFTAADDYTAGTTLNTTIWSGYTGNPTGKYYGEYALWLNTSANIALNNLRFCYMNYAIQINADVSGQTVSLSHSELVDCISAIYVNGGNGSSGSGSGDTLTLSANNCLMANVHYPFQAVNITLYGTACNCTIDSCTNLLLMGADTSGTFKFTNCILSRVASEGTLGSVTLSAGYNGFYSSPTFGSSQTSVSTYPFESVGAGNYYIPTTSSFLGIGTTNVGTALLSQLQVKTTESPLILTNSVTLDTTLVPVVQRDTNGTTLGWHYDPIDYISACDVSNATLFLVDGVALAYFDNLGIWLQDNSQLVAQGAPNNRNYLVYYGLVQEQPANLWVTNGVPVTNEIAQAMPVVPLPVNSTNGPSIFLRLTTICAPQGETNLLNTADSNQVISGLTLQDCEVYGAGANWLMRESTNEPAVGLTNNIFHRVPFGITNNVNLTAYNNLFYGTTNTNTFMVSIQRHSGSSTNIIENNVFDGVSASLVGTVAYNAYLHGATNIAYTNNHDVWTNITWVAGPLGAYYQATNSPLINAGSTSASNVGLYHYTVTTNLVNGYEIKETNSIVDLGYHFVAVDSNGIPIVSVTQGLPDYLDGSSPTGISNSWLMEYFGTLYVNPNADYDGTGSTILQDYQQGYDPNIITFQLSCTNQYLKTSSASMQLTFVTGMPTYMATLVDSTNWSGADWIPYNPSFSVSVGTTQGWHQIWVGLRGLSTISQQTWAWYGVKLDTTPPLLVITNPASLNVTQPMIEVQGFCPEALASLIYSLSNASGILSNQQAFVLNQYHATNSWEFTTNTFQAFDVPLTNGVNILTFQATDLAGNVTTTNFTYTLSYAGRTNPPAVQLYWPQNGTQISGTNFTLRGLVNDLTTTLEATILGTNGVTITFDAVVERNGNFWVENLPLGGGSNVLTLTATDVASNVTTTNFTVVGSALELTMNSDGYSLWNTATNISGNITYPASYTVWVNGVKATSSSGSWEAENVAMTPGGSAVFQVRAIANSDHGGNGTGGGGTLSYANLCNPTSATAIDAEITVDKPERSYVSQYTLNFSQSYNELDPVEYWSQFWSVSTEYTWSDGTGGSGNLLESISADSWPPGGPLDSLTQEVNWPATYWPNLVEGTLTASTNGIWEVSFGTPPSAYPPSIYLEYCDIDLPTNYIISPGFTDDETFDRQAQCAMNLNTGGKGIPGVQGLFCLTGSATDLLTGEPIPPQNISIGSLGNLDSNSNLWIVLPSGDPEATPRVSGKLYYTFTLNGTTYIPQITANGTVLDPQYANATFCVGQQINFALTFSPELPIALSNAVYHWTLPANYVNSVISNSAGCPVYSTNPSLLQSSALTNWYYNGPGGTASVSVDFTLPNGKSASAGTLGKFWIYRPTLTNFQNLETPAIYMWASGGGVLINLGTETHTNTVWYSVFVNSSAAGIAGITQVYNDESYPTNYGSNVLDAGILFYPNPGPQNISINTTHWNLNELSLIDQPNEPCGASSGGLILQFTDFVRFIPSAGNENANIYVTLGQVAWNVDATATNAGEGWALNQGPQVTPTLNTNDAWAFWTTNGPSGGP
jgi:hypothetical protein